MKKILVMTAILTGCSFCAMAQNTQSKPTVKQAEQKTQQKGTPTKQTIELKSTSTNTASAPLILPIPKPEVDTTFLPVVKNMQRKP